MAVKLTKKEIKDWRMPKATKEAVQEAEVLGSKIQKEIANARF